MYTVGNGTNGIQLVPHTPEYCIQLFRVVPKGSVVPCAARHCIEPASKHTLFHIFRSTLMSLMLGR